MLVSGLALLLVLPLPLLRVVRSNSVSSSTGDGRAEEAAVEVEAELEGQQQLLKPRYCESSMVLGLSCVLLLQSSCSQTVITFLCIGGPKVAKVR